MQQHSVRRGGSRLKRHSVRRGGSRLKRHSVRRGGSRLKRHSVRRGGSRLKRHSVRGGGSRLKRWNVNQKVRGSNPPTTVSKLGQFRSPHPCSSVETLKGLFYVAFMPGEVQYPTQGNGEHIVDSDPMVPIC